MLRSSPQVRITFIETILIIVLSLAILPLLFVPLFVRLLDIQPILRQYGLRLLILIVFTTVMVITATALTAKLFLHIAASRGVK